MALRGLPSSEVKFGSRMRMLPGLTEVTSYKSRDALCLALGQLGLVILARLSMPSA